MFDEITFWTDDKVWRGILSDLGAVAVDESVADFVLKSSEFRVQSSDNVPSIIELKSHILAEIDRTQREILRKIFGRDVSQSMSPVQIKIVIALYRAGAAGCGGEDLRNIMGYSAGTNTHAGDTAIYTLRKMFGNGFIVNDGGRYKLKFVGAGSARPI